MKLVLAVALGGFLGAPARYHVDRLLQRGLVFPFGTLTVNAIGSLLLGLLVGVVDDTATTYALLGIGFCGAFTTYSTFGYETLRLFEDGARPHAVANVLANLVVGIGFAALGMVLT